MNRIASLDVTKYVMERLELFEQEALVINFNEMLEKLKKIGSENFTKESLLRFIQAYASKLRWVGKQWHVRAPTACLRIHDVILVVSIVILRECY